MSLLIIAILVVEAIAAAFFCVFSIVFFLHRKALNLEYAIKERFNDIACYSYTNKFKHLQLLAKNNVQLEKILNTIFDNKKFFDSQLGVVRTKIMNLSRINSKYFYRKSTRLSKDIANDLDKCQLMVNDLKHISASATEYSKSVNDLIVDYRTTANNISSFYELHLASKYNNEIFKNIFNAINNLINEAQSYITKFNNEHLLTILQKINSHITTFFHTVLELYIINRLSIYLTTIQKQIHAHLKVSAKNLSSVDLFSIEKNNVIAKNNIEMMNQHLKTITLKQAHDNAVVATKHLEKSLSKLQMGDTTNVLIQQNMKLLDNQIIQLTKGINDISTSFANILKYFGKKDPFTTNKIRKLVNELQAVTYFYQRLEQTFKDYGSIDRRDFLNNISQLSKQIIHWKNDLNNLITSIFKQYKQVITINDELAEIKLTLSQLLGIKIRFNTNDNKSIEAIRNIIAKIVSFQDQLAGDYFGKYPIIQSELNSIKKQAIIIMESSGFDETLKIYAQKMIFFLNKYRNEAPQIRESLDVVENYYKQNKYQQTIDMLIEIISNISDSAKSNKIMFN
jgi:hypothetical protein